MLFSIPAQQWLSQQIHSSGWPHSSLPRIRRLLHVLLSDLPTRAACRLLGSSARSMDIIDFFGIKPSQVDCPLGCRMGGRASGGGAEESKVTAAIC